MSCVLDKTNGYQLSRCEQMRPCSDFDEPCSNSMNINERNECDECGYYYSPPPPKKSG